MIVVTGGAGFIGSAFIWKLNQEGITDIIVVDSLGKSPKWRNLVGLDFIDFIDKHIFLEQIQTHKPAYPITYLIHLGANSSTTETDVDYLIQNNFKYSQALATWAVDNKVPFMYASSAATYGDGLEGFTDDEKKLSVLRPINPYGFSKQLFDTWAYRSNLLSQIIGLKYFNVFGPNEYHKGDMRSLVCKAFFQIQETQQMKLFKSHRPDYQNGEQKRDFVYIKDCIDVMWWMMNQKNVSGIFNLGTGAARSWNDLAHALFKAMNIPPKIQYVDMPENIKDQYQYWTQANMTKLLSLKCPIQFRPLEDAIDDYVKGYLSQQVQNLTP